MIITLIAISLIIIAIVGFLILDKTHFSYIVDDIVCFITALSGVLGSITILICLTVILCSHIDVDYDIHKAQLEHDSIIKQLEYIDAEYENVSKVEIIQKVYEWNQKVYSEKHGSENLWINWFYSKKYADSLEYIELITGGN